MRTATKLLLAGAGIVAVAGAAVAASDRGHVLNVALPDGSIAHIHYVGDVAPQVVMAPSADPLPVAFVAADPFAMFDQISYAMDRQMDAMLRQASALSAIAPGPDGKLSQAALQSLLSRFSPDVFDRKLEGGALDRFLPANRKARQWDLLLELYEDIAKEAGEDFWSVFEREFRRAYATGSQAPAPRR